MINLRRLRMELARLGLNYLDLARRLRVPPSTLSSWLNRRNPAPPDLGARIEKALGVALGTLAESVEKVA